MLAVAGIALALAARREWQYRALREGHDQQAKAYARYAFRHLEELGFCRRLHSLNVPYISQRDRGRMLDFDEDINQRLCNVIWPEFTNWADEAVSHEMTYKQYAEASGWHTVARREAERHLLFL